MFNKHMLLLIILTPMLSGCFAVIATGAVVVTDIAADRRTSGSYIEDQSIEIKASRLLANDASLKNSSSIDVVSHNRIVLLVGQAPSQNLRELAADIIRKIENIRKIHNEIRIASPDSFLSGTSDTWITTKAKSLMLAEKGFSSRHIKVVTENGELFLMGIVSRAEADKAVTIVRDIDGVEQVVQVFEYVQ